MDRLDRASGSDGSGNPDNCLSFLKNSFLVFLSAYMALRTSMEIVVVIIAVAKIPVGS